MQYTITLYYSYTSYYDIFSRPVGCFSFRLIPFFPTRLMTFFCLPVTTNFWWQALFDVILCCTLFKQFCGRRQEMTCSVWLSLFICKRSFLIFICTRIFFIASDCLLSCFVCWVRLSTAFPAHSKVYSCLWVTDALGGLWVHVASSWSHVEQNSYVRAGADMYSFCVHSSMRIPCLQRIAT